MAGRGVKRENMALAVTEVRPSTINKVGSSIFIALG